jgi:hypothetical protein
MQERCDVIASKLNSKLQENPKATWVEPKFVTAVRRDALHIRFRDKTVISSISSAVIEVLNLPIRMI